MQISLVEFSVENFKVFKNKATFSMVARKNDAHTFESKGENLLKTSFIYGPNASGKSSFLEALTNLRQAILFSANNTETDPLPYTPFLASEESKDKPVFFELVFTVVGTLEGVYRYNFSFLRDRMVAENLTKISATGTEENYISRKEQEITLGKAFEDAKVLIGKVRKETLFLSVAAQFNSRTGLDILNALKDSLNIISGITYMRYQNFTVKMFKDDSEYKEHILQYLKMADFCISGGHAEEVDVNRVDIKDGQGEFSASKRIAKRIALFFQHSVYDKENQKTGSFKLPLDMESVGTQRFTSVLGPIIDTLKNGKVLLIDEFDSSLHPLLTKFIVDLFESSETNNHNAQLIVTTHDTSLLSYRDDFLKDQFWFTDKDEFGSAKLFSLAEFTIRNDTEFAKKYLEGRFGALPFINPVKK